MLTNFFIAQPSNPQSVNTQIIMLELSGDAAHSAHVANDIGIGYGIDNSSPINHTVNGVTISCSIAMFNWLNSRVIFQNSGSIAASMLYAQQNNIRLVVNSDTGFGTTVNTTALAYYPSVQLFMPLGSNSHILIQPPNAESCVIVTGGSHSSDYTQNATAYGASLVFFDFDDGDSSDANGIIAGKLLYVKEQRSKNVGYETTWWDARYSAMQTAQYNPSFPLQDANNGWGQIVVADAIAFAGTIPADPYFI